MVHAANRSKLAGSRSFRSVSPKARRLLSILFVTGLCFFAFLSFSTYVKDPEQNNLQTASTRIRRALYGGPSHQKPAAVSTAGKPVTGPFKLLLASHGRLFWYFPHNDSIKVLHEGQGVHYGVFPGEYNTDGSLKTVWNVLRPHNWHPTLSEEFLVQIDATKAREVSRVRIQSRFTHDAIREGNRVFICNTEHGEVQELDYPRLDKVRSMKLFTLRQHVNTLAALSHTDLWVVLHNLGKSDVVHIDLGADPPKEVSRIKSVGSKAHGLVLWGDRFVMLDSEGGALITVDPATGVVTKVYQMPEEKPTKFLKGLAVVDGTAYFGVSVWAQRSERDKPDRNSEVAAVDLTSGELVWRREVPSKGLLNVIAAPQLGEASTYRAMSYATATPSASAANTTYAAGKAPTPASSLANDALSSLHSSETRAVQSGHVAHALRSIDDAAVQAASKKLDAMGYKPLVGGHWSNNVPYLNLSVKDSPKSYQAGIQLPLMQLDVSALKAKVLALPEEMWQPSHQRVHNAAVDGRKDNMQKYKPGVDALYMVFSDQSTENVFRFPYFSYFQAEVEPLLEEIVGKEDMHKVVRMQFARMNPSSEIKMHRDMGGYAKKAHRIHIPIVTHPDVNFQVCPDLEKQRLGSDHDKLPDTACVTIPMSEGMVFEVNNRVLHRVYNRSPIKRVQLVVDFSETPRAPRLLKEGTVCNYVNAKMICP